MAWWTNQSPWCLLLIQYQTCTKKNYWEIGQYQKTYKHLVFKRSFYLWKSNSYQVFIIPAFVYISLLLLVPKEIVKELNQMIFKFLWKGIDKVTRLSTINEYENGGLKMIDLESMIKSWRLAWLKRIFQCNNGAWRSFLRFLLEPFGGLFLFHCNYDIKKIHISSKFYSELLQWWSQFRSVFDSRRECQYILWNNKEIRVDNKPVFYKKNFLNKMSFSSFVWIRHHRFFYYCFE